MLSIFLLLKKYFFLSVFFLMIIPQSGHTFGAGPVEDKPEKVGACLITYNHTDSRAMHCSEYSVELDGYRLSRVVDLGYGYSANMPCISSYTEAKEMAQKSSSCNDYSRYASKCQVIDVLDPRVYGKGDPNYPDFDVRIKCGGFLIVSVGSGDAPNELKVISKTCYQDNDAAIRAMKEISACQL